MRRHHPCAIRELPASDLLRDPELARWVEGYAAACADLMGALTGDYPGAKSYDPLTVDPQSGELHSYAFDLKNGGRHHPIADYETIAEIVCLLCNEAIDWIRSDA